MPEWKVLVNFSRFRAATHISRVNCAEMAEDRPRQQAYEMLPLNVDFSSVSPDSLNLRPARAGVKKGTP